MYERGLNLSDLAKKTGLQRQTISLYATGQRNPDTERLTSICHALNCSSDYLLGLSNEKTSNVERQAIEGLTGLKNRTIDWLITEKDSRFVDGVEQITLASFLNFIAEEDYELYGELKDDAHKAMTASLKTDEYLERVAYCLLSDPVYLGFRKLLNDAGADIVSGGDLADYLISRMGSKLTRLMAKYIHERGKKGYLATSN